MRDAQRLVQRELLSPHLPEGAGKLTRQEWRREILGQTALAALTAQGEMLGVAFIEPSHNPDPEQFEGEAPYLSFVVVHGKHQGKGIGHALLRATEEYAIDVAPEGVDSTILLTAPVLGSVAMYEALGYTRLTTGSGVGESGGFWGKTLELPTSGLDQNDI